MIADINNEGAEKVVEEIRSGGAQASATKTDVGRDEDVAQLVDRTIQEFGTIDILVNNAFYNLISAGDFHKTDPSLWDPQIEVNFKGMLRTCYRVIPHMMENKWGRIINIICI